MCGKLFERFIFSSLFNYLDDSILLSFGQSGFRCNNSYVNELLAIFHEIYAAFDVNSTFEKCGVFLDM